MDSVIYSNQDTHETSSNEDISVSTSLSNASNLLDDISNSSVSTDLEKSSFHSLNQIDKEEIFDKFPNQEICNRQFNQAFNVPIKKMKTFSSPVTEANLGFELKGDHTQEFSVKKEIFELKQEMKKQKEFFDQDLRRRILIKKKYLTEQQKLSLEHSKEDLNPLLLDYEQGINL